MVVVPGDNPLTTPAELMVATEGLVLDHIPPSVASVSVTNIPTHTVVGPTIIAGSGLTVYIAVTVPPLAM